MTSDPTEQLFLIADELRGAAELAGRFATDVYERERIDHLRQLARRLVGVVDQGRFDDLAPLPDDAWGRVSPAVGVDAVTLDAAGRVLLCRRRDNGRWCLPGGLFEVGQSPSDAALKELWEEAGLRGTVIRLLGVFDGRSWGTTSTAHLIHLVYAVDTVDTDPIPGTEMTETGYFSPDALPTPMHSGHGRRVPYCLELVASGRTHADAATSVDADLPLHQRP